MLKAFAVCRLMTNSNLQEEGVAAPRNPTVGSLARCCARAASGHAAAASPNLCRSPRFHDCLRPAPGTQRSLIHEIDKDGKVTYAS
jgi:hypothetical protein